MAAYTCCKCGVDMTATVLRLAGETGIAYRARREAAMPTTVTATCPNGHACTYDLQR
jgi:hypothetical protein